MPLALENRDPLLICAVLFLPYSLHSVKIMIIRGYLTNEELARYVMAHLESFRDSSIDGFVSRVLPTIDAIGMAVICPKQNVRKIFGILEPMNTCWGCHQFTSASKLRTCSRCRFCRYCSHECQALHWANHKVSCKSLKQDYQMLRATVHIRSEGQSYGVGVMDEYDYNLFTHIIRLQKRIPYISLHFLIFPS